MYIYVNMHLFYRCIYISPVALMLNSRPREAREISQGHTAKLCQSRYKPLFGEFTKQCFGHWDGGRGSTWHSQSIVTP